MNIKDLVKKYRWIDWFETKYYNITIGISNISEWLPIVWRDREWEYDYFTMQFIYKKLKLHQKRPYDECFENGWWMTRYINLCIWLIEEEQRMEDLEDDLWKSIEPGEMEWGKPDEKGLMEMKSVWSSPEAKEKYWAVEKIRYVRQKKIHRLIYKILANRGSCWWD
jgi:hypothetical protein